MPNQETINRYFTDSSFWFKPRDKVSGDFYFVQEAKNNLYFGVGDCTGHGIPGSILSVMSVEAVKSVLLNSNQEKPDKILEKLRIIAKERFSVNIHEKRSDSMDAAICMFNREENKLYYAGGFINLFIIRNNCELIEYKATRCPIGTYPVEYDFELHEITLLKGDVIYLASDGFVDQFGHDKNSNHTKSVKFKNKRFKELILSISHLDCNQQTDILKKMLEEWRGKVDQTDDITIFIVRH
jgi:serine phosphatase RsbU (regulator of sigma subunit)